MSDYISQFQDELQLDLALRKFEIQKIFNLIDDYWAKNNEELAAKLLVPNLYSHWEGHFTVLIRQFFILIGNLDIPFVELNDFLKIFIYQIKGDYKFFSDKNNQLMNSKFKRVEKISENFIRFNEEQKNIDWFELGRDFVPTMNLSFDNWIKWMTILGFPEIVEDFMREKNKIESILKIRNPSSHGDMYKFQNLGEVLTYSSIKEKRNILLKILTNVDNAIVEKVSKKYDYRII